MFPQLNALKFCLFDEIRIFPLPSLSRWVESTVETHAGLLLMIILNAVPECSSPGVMWTRPGSVLPVPSGLSFLG